VLHLLVELKHKNVMQLTTYEQLESTQAPDDFWFKNLEVAVGKTGGRVHLFKNVLVDYSRNHNAAAMTGGPDTGKNYDVLKAGDTYPLPLSKKVTETFVSFNWPEGEGSYDKAVTFGVSNGLERTIPHEVFAVGEHFPNLNHELGVNPMYVAETTGCWFNDHAEACYVWWGDAKRESRLRWQSNFVHKHGWFLFRYVPSVIKLD